MNIFTANTFIKAKVVHKIFLSPEEKVSYSSVFVWWKPNTWFRAPLVNKETLYVLRMSYINEDGRSYEYTSSSSDHAVMKDVFAKITDQIKFQDREITDREFEEAMMNSGKDPK